MYTQIILSPDSQVHGANMGPTWVLSAPDGPHVGPMNLVFKVCIPNFAEGEAALLWPPLLRHICPWTDLPRHEPDFLPKR